MSNRRQRIPPSHVALLTLFVGAVVLTGMAILWVATGGI